MDQHTPEWMPLYEEALGHDRFLGEFCAKCGHRGTGWADGHLGIAIRCPKCLRDRVRSLRDVHGTLPSAVAYLEKMADGDIRKQGVDNRDDLTVDFDVFCRCAHCDALIHRKDARYWLPPGAKSSPAYCIDCYQALRASGEQDQGN